MPKKKEIYILYLILKDKGNLLKIGITRKTNFKSRIYNIEKDFGKINYNNSYICYSKDRKKIDNLEKLLHKTYDKDRLPKKFKEGVGKTEWFRATILIEVKKQIIYLKKNNKDYKELSKLKRLNGEDGIDYFRYFNIFINIIKYGIYIVLLYSLSSYFYKL